MKMSFITNLNPNRIKTRNKYLLIMKDSNNLYLNDFNNKQHKLPLNMSENGLIKNRTKFIFDPK